MQGGELHATQLFMPDAGPQRREPHKKLKQKAPSITYMLSTEAARALIALKTKREQLTVSNDLLFAGQLTGKHVTRILDASPIENGLLPVPKPDKKPRYLIAVRSLGTNTEQYLHPNPVKTLKGWFRHFLHTPLFQRFNLALEPDFPDLDKPVAAWSTARFSKNGGEYIAIAASAVPKKMGDATLNRDAVLFHLFSPSLPHDHASLNALCKDSSHARRSVGTHMAIAAMAVVQNMEVVPTVVTAPDVSDHLDAGFEHGDSLTSEGTFARIHLSGALHSYEKEASAGGSVIPLVMRHCFFLGPALSEQTPVQYDILQPHRYAYIFRVRFLSGWELFGSTNLYAQADMLRAMWGDEISQMRAPLLVANPERWTACVDTARLFTKVLRATQIQCVQNFISDAAPHLASPALQPFLDASGQLSYRTHTNDAQKSALPPEVWHHLMCIVRIERMQASLKTRLEELEQGSHTALGDRFLLGQPLTDTETATVLYEALHGMVALLLPDDQDDAQSVLDATTPPKKPPLAIDQLAPRASAAFLLGKAPRQWAQCALAIGEPGLKSTLRHIARAPTPYATLVGERVAALKPAFFDAAALLYSSLADAKLDADWCIKAGQKKHKLTRPEDAPQRLAKRRNGLVYYLFSRNTGVSYDKWA